MMNHYFSNTWKLIASYSNKAFRLLSDRDSSGNVYVMPLSAAKTCKLNIATNSPATPYQRLESLQKRYWRGAPKRIHCSLHAKLQYLLVCVFISVAQYGIAQQSDFTMAEAINGMAGKFAIKNLKQLQWTGSSDMYSFISEDSIKQLNVVNPNTFQSQALTTLDKLNGLLEAKAIKPLGNFPTLKFMHQKAFYFQHDAKIIYCDFGKPAQAEIEVIASLPEKAENIMVDTSKMSVSFVLDNNLYVCYRNASPIKISKDGSNDIVYGQSVHRNEFGIDNGTFWSPAGNFIAFYRMDQSMVEDYPIVNWNETPATVKKIKYPFAGRTSHEVKLGIFDCKTAKITYLNIDGPKDQYLTTVTWSPDEKNIYVSLLNRDQNALALNRYDAASGQLVKTILEETNPRYVEPQHPLYFYNNDPAKFIWWSQKDGFMHLYHYVNDVLDAQLTKGNWLVNEVVGYSKRNNEIVFTSSQESPMQKNVYAVNVLTKAMRRISTTMATHTAQLSSSGGFLIDQYVGKEIPRNIEIVNLVNNAEKRILTASNTLLNYKTARVELVTLEAKDQTELFGKLIYPIGFDETKKYPVIVYLYNGPHVQLNKDMFPYSGNLWYDYMAQRGYFVFVLDGHGSSNRGFAFESAIHRNLGSLEIEDQLRGVNYLKTLPFIDANRMGIHGWSYGGFITSSFMLKQAGVFKCGVAGGPVLDWSMYEIMYGERYMDTPQQNPEGYASNLLLDKIKNLKGKLLLIHGTDDDVVLWQHSLKMIKKSVDEGVQLDYFVYPGHPHNVRGKDRVHLMQKVSDYFDLYLK